MGVDEYQSCDCGCGDDISRKLDVIFERLDELTHRVADIEFKLGIFTESRNQYPTRPIEEIFEKIDEMDKKASDKKR